MYPHRHPYPTTIPTTRPLSWMPPWLRAVVRLLALVLLLSLGAIVGGLTGCASQHQGLPLTLADQYRPPARTEASCPHPSAVQPTAAQAEQGARLDPQYWANQYAALAKLYAACRTAALAPPPRPAGFGLTTQP